MIHQFKTKTSPLPSMAGWGEEGAVYRTKDSGSGFTKEKQILNQDREKVSI